MLRDGGRRPPGLDLLQPSRRSKEADRPSPHARRSQPSTRCAWSSRSIHMSGPSSVDGVSTGRHARGRTGAIPTERAAQLRGLVASRLERPATCEAKCSIYRRPSSWILCEVEVGPLVSSSSESEEGDGRLSRRWSGGGERWQDEEESSVEEVGVEDGLLRRGSVARS